MQGKSAFRPDASGTASGAWGVSMVTGPGRNFTVGLRGDFFFVNF